MPAARAASMGAYTGLKQNPDYLRKTQNALTKAADNNKPQTPMQPANTPGVKTTANPQTPKTYVAPPPTPQQPQPQVIGQVPGPNFGATQAPVQQPQKTQVPTSPVQAPAPIENAGSMPPPAASGFNPSMVQGQDWWRQLAGYQPQWNTTANAIKQAVGALDPSMVPQFNAPLGYRDNLIAGINYLKNPPPPAGGGGGGGGQGGYQPQIPMYNEPKFPAGEMVPEELGQGTPGADPWIEKFNTWVKILGGDSVKSETKWELWNYLMGEKEKQTALGERDQAMGILGGSNPSDPLNAMIQQLSGQVAGQPGAIIPGIDTPERTALRGSLMDTLSNPVIGDQMAEYARTGIREAGFGDTNAALDQAKQDFASRGIQGGFSEEALARLGMQGDAATQASLRDYDLQRNDINRQGLERSQAGLGAFLGEDYGQRLQAADLARGTSQSALSSLLDASGTMFGQDWEKKRALADALLGTQRTAPDMSGIFGTQSVLRRPLPEPDSNEPSALDKLLGIASPIASIASLFL